MKYLVKQSKVLTLRDNFPDIENYDFIDIGLQNIEVSKIVGICDSRADEYSADFSPINKNDPRWIRLYNGYKNGDNIPPLDLILAPDNRYYGDGDGSHRISVAKTLNLQTVPAKVMKMVAIDQGINSSWQEYAKERIDKLHKLSKEYQSMWPKFYQLQDKAFESGNHIEYEKFQEQMKELGNKISILEEELMNEEKEYKQSLLKENSIYKRLKIADDMGGDMGLETTETPTTPTVNVVNNETVEPRPERMWYPPYSVYRKKNVPKTRLKKLKKIKK